MSNLTLEQVLTQEAWTLATRSYATKCLPGWIGHSRVDIVIEPFSDGVVIAVGSGGYLLNGVRQFFETDVDGLMLHRSLPGVYADSFPLWGASSIEFDDAAQAALILSDMLGMQIEGEIHNVGELAVRMHWQWYPDSFYEDVSSALQQGFLLEGFEMLPHNAYDLAGHPEILDEALGDAPLGKCKSVKRALALRPAIIPLVARIKAFRELSDPNLFCLFLNGSRAVTQLIRIIETDPTGEIFPCVFELYNPKQVLKTLASSKSPSAEYWRVGSGVSTAERLGLENVKRDLARLRAMGLNAAEAINAIGKLPDYNHPFGYSAQHRLLEQRIGRFSFHLPKDPLHLVFLGEKLHNCLSTYADRSFEGYAVLYVLDEERGGRICAAIEFDLDWPRAYQRYYACNKPIPDDSPLGRAIKKLTANFEALKNGNLEAA